jgi:hypothetical protein
MATNLQTHRVPNAQSQTWHGGVVKPGHGTAQLFLRQTMEQVRALLGSAKKRARKGTHVFWVYPELGVDVEFSGQRVSGLFFFRRREEGHAVTAAVHLHSVRFGAHRNDVISRLGEPLDNGSLADGRTWMLYSGLQLDFDPEELLARITIFQ